MVFELAELLEIDGSFGEGGGSIIRIALPLAALLNRKVKVFNIRANRPKPGMKMQHVVGAKAVKWLSNASVSGLSLESKEMTFAPGKLQGGNFSLNIQTAGSISLLLQSVMPLAPFLPAPLTARVQGGTDVSWSPPIDFTGQVLFPALHLMGYNGSIKVIKRGYFPEGGGIVTGQAKPVKHLKALNLTEFGELDYVSGVSHCVNYPSFTARDAVSGAKNVLSGNGLADASFSIECQEKVPSRNKGLGVMLLGVTTSNARIASSALLSRDLPTAEKVGEAAAGTLLKYLEFKAPVDPHLQDQLLVYMALAEGKSFFLTHPLTEHAKTNIWAIEQLLPVKFRVEGEEVQGKELSLVSVDGVGFNNAHL